jgi:hypothetical protein
MTDKEVMQMALDALESECDATKFGAAEALRTRLAQPEPTLALWNFKHNRLAGLSDDRAEVVLIRQREWQGLTDEEINYAWRMGEANINESNFEFCYRAIEAKLKEKNT